MTDSHFKAVITAPSPETRSARHHCGDADLVVGGTVGREGKEALRLLVAEAI